MTIEFDDLIPTKGKGKGKGKGIEFDDLLPVGKPPAGSWTDNVRDPIAAVLKIGPTAIKGVADLGRLVTGDSIGQDTSNAMKRGMTSIDEVVGSERLRTQKQAVSSALVSPDVGLSDLPGVILNNPRAALDTAISTVGSMALPVGAGAAAVRYAPALAKLFPALATATPGAVATTAAIGTGAAQNAAETFADTNGRPMADRYTGAGISGAASLVLGKLLGGGAEGVVARRLAGTGLTRGVAEGAKSAVQTGGKEFVQEAGEEGMNYVGKQIAMDEAIDPLTGLKQASYGGAIGFGVGGAADVASNAGNLSTGGAERAVARAIEDAANNYADQAVPGFPQLAETTISAPAESQIEFDDLIPQAREKTNTQALSAIENVANANNNQAPVAPPEAPVLDAAPAPAPAGNAVQPAASGPLLQAGRPESFTPPLKETPDVQNPAPAPQAAAQSPQTPADQAPAAPGIVAAGQAAAGTPARASAVQAHGLAQENAQNQAVPQAVAPSNAIESVAPNHLGRDNTPLSEGGKPFKTKLQADTARKLQPAMRVIRVDGGYALADKTQKQLDAQDKAARRLRNAQTSPPGQAIPAHAMIAAAGGMLPSTRSDMGMEGNVKIGNRTLFAGKTGNGLTLERATEKLIEDGYLPENASHSDAIALIKRSLSNPQYTPEGVERMAEQEAQAAADANDSEQEAIAAHQALEDNELDEVIAAAEAAMRDIPETESQSKMSFENAMRYAGFTEQEIQDGIANQSREPQGDSQGVAGPVQAAAGASPQSDSGRESTPGSVQGQDTGLSAPSQQEVLAQQDRKDNAAALDQGAQIDKEASQQKLEQPGAPEQRKDTSGDMFAMEKATAEMDARNAGQASKNDPNQSGMFDEPAPAAAATQILDAADIKGKDRLEALRDVRAGLITPQELKTAYPATVQISQQAGVRGSARTGDGVRQVLSKRFGPMIARMEKRGFLRIWDGIEQFNAAGQRSRRIEGAAQGMWDGKTAHLFADGIPEGQEVAVMLHEVGEHASMHKMLGTKSYKRLVARAHELMFADDPTALAAVARIPDDTPERFRDSELLAYMIETVAAADVKASPGARKWLADMVAAIRAWWSTTGLATKLVDFGIRMEFTPNDIAALAVRAVKWQGGQTAPVRGAVDAVATDSAQTFSRQVPTASSWTAPVGSPPVNPKTGALAPQPWNVAEPGTMDNFVRAIQNNKIDLKRVRDAIAQGATISQQADAYLNEELYHGRVSARVTALHEQQVEPILKKIAVAGKNVGITLDDVNQYLHAQHAPERNAAMQAINPGMANNAALSGMRDAEASTILADFKATGKEAGLATIVKDVYQLLSDTRTGMVADGLEDASTVQAWEQAYKHYAPLQRDIKTSGTPKGQGISIRGPEAKRAMGSNKEVVNILANIVAQAETAAIRAEKAIVGRSLLDMARQNPNPKFWKVDAAPTKARIDKETGLVIRNAVDPMFQTADNVVMVKDYGIEHFIVFEKNSERAMAVAKAMKNLEIAPMNKILEVASKGTRFIASLLTQRNPLFWMTNFARDLQGALINLEGTKAEGLQLRILANLGKSFKGMHAIVRGQGGGQWARYATELQEAGGTTGYMQQFENSDARMKDLQKEVDRMGQGTADPRRLGRLVLDFVDDYNDIVENAVRLSVFQTAREGGASTASAASIAKNITVNFNRKGNLTPPINALYMFFNASVQGTARLAQAITTSRNAQIIVGGIAIMGFLMDALNRAMSDDDEETGRNRYDMIPEFEKSKNWIFMNPMKPGQYVKVPLPLGPHVFHNVGRLLSDAVFRDDPRNASEYGWSMASTVLDAFSPLGITPSVGQFISPSVLDPVLQVAENKSFTGGPVYKSAETGFGKTDPKPAYTRHFENTPDVWKAASRGLNDLTGGDKDKPGALNVEPDIMKHVVYSMTGGPGRTLDQAVDASQSQARGEAPSVNRIPFVSRFYGENDDRQRQRVYYDDRKRAADAKTQHDHFAKIGRGDLARQVAEDLGDGDAGKGRRMMHELSSAQSSVSKINKQIRNELLRQDNGEDRTTQLTDLKKRRVKVMGGTGRAPADE